MTVGAGRHLGAAVLLGGVGERQPHGEVLLRLDVRVAVVLVPRDPPRLLGLLVHGLVPVEPHVGADEVGAEPEDRGVGAERLGLLRARHGVDRDRERAGLGDGEAAVLAGLEERVDLRLEPVEVLPDLRQGVGVDEVGHHDEALLVELATCSGVSVVKGPSWSRQSKRSFQGWRLHRPARYRNGTADYRSAP